MVAHQLVALLVVDEVDGAERVHRRPSSTAGCSARRPFSTSAVPVMILNTLADGAVASEAMSRIGPSSTTLAQTSTLPGLHVGHDDGALRDVPRAEQAHRRALVLRTRS